jgi:transposase InsO family protein
MPWMETCSMTEKARFCVAYESGEGSMSELCRQFGVSRKTGYAILARWRADGLAGLAERSHAPHCCAHALSAAVRAAVLGLRHRHPTWGPKKIKARLAQREPEMAWPAASTIGDMLSREGLVVRRKRRRHAAPRTAPLAAARAANDTWSVDFKGWFRTGEGARCDALTVQDQASRYLIRVVAVDSMDTDHVWAVLAAAFREFGLPKVVRSDNGPPFASTGTGGLSALSVRLVKAGVMPERIDPASPQQNGRLERLHLTLKQETASPPAASLAAQGRRFRAFLQVYNEERPHEALGMAVPASLYEASARAWSGRLVSPEYGPGVEVRRVRTNGEIKWAGGLVWVSSVLIGEPVGMEEGEDGVWRVRYGPVLLGTIDANGRLRRPRAARATSSVGALRTSGAPAGRTEQCVTHHAG